MNQIFPLLKSERANLEIIEFISSLIYAVLNNSTQLIGNFQKDIKDNFQNLKFFNCSVNTLNCWNKILMVMLANSQYHYIDEVLYSITFTSSVFTSENKKTEKRIVNFSRLCFLIFSGKQDIPFLDKPKIKAILEKINTVMKNPKSNPAIVILILFCLRIMILKLPDDILKEIFTNIWPSLLTFMVSSDFLFFLPFV